MGSDSSHDLVLVGCDRQGSTVAPDFDHLGQASPHAEVEERLLGVRRGGVVAAGELHVSKRSRML